MPNPFRYNLPALARDFVGRRTLAAQIADDLKTPNGDSYAIVGGRRAGKSSLLLYLKDLLVAPLQQAQSSAMLVLPVYVPLQEIIPINSSQDVLGFMLHRIREVAAGPAPSPPFEGRLIDLGLLEYSDPQYSPATLPELQAGIKEVVAAAARKVVDLRVAFLMDEMDECVGFPWTDGLFGNLRSPIYAGPLRPYLRLVTAGSNRFLSVDERGSPLFNVLTKRFLDTLDDEGMEELFLRAEPLHPAVAKEVRQLSGGHPFIAQYLLHHLYETGMQSATIGDVHAAGRRFLNDRNEDLEGWWNAIAEDGQRAFCILQKASGWMTEDEILLLAGDVEFQADRGLRALAYHGVAIHDGTYQRYRLQGQLFWKWGRRRRREAIPAPLPDPAPGPLGLAGAQLKGLTTALCSAFTQQEMERLLRFDLDRRLWDYAGPGPLPAVFYGIVDAAERQGWMADLIMAARQQNPGNPQLRAFAQQFDLAPVIPPTLELESMLREDTGFLDLDEWFTRLGQIMSQVCSIEVPEQGAYALGQGSSLVRI